MLEIIGMSKDELLGLNPASLTRPDSINRMLTKEEVVYIAKTLGAFWQYDYEAAKLGKVGMHAILKSLLHSDGFFISRILLGFQNIRWIFANQIVLKLNQLHVPRPDWIVGIPDGATELGRDVAAIMGVKNAKMRKEEDGRIVLESVIRPGETLLVVEDFCTRGTGFIEAILEMLSKCPQTVFLPYEGVILNRGGLKEIKVEGIARPFQIIPVAEHRINDCKPEECQLCAIGSTPIKPKATDENWKLITASQL